MEPDNDEQLRPQLIDDQIERLVQCAQEGTLENNLNAQLVQHLQRHYESEKHKKMLQRAWKSIALRYENGVTSSMEEEHAQNEQYKLKGSGKYIMREQTMKILPMKRVLPRWGTLAAIAVLVLVIGSTALILSRVAAQRNGIPGTGGSGGHSVCPPTPTPAPEQTTVTPTPAPERTTVTPTPAPERITVTPTPAPIATATATACVSPIKPTVAPIAQPPTARPTAAPIAQPTVVPGSGSAPTARPTAAPIAQPTVAPIAQPTAAPIAQPTVAPEPRSTPTPQPGR